jgi:hypothetical protein
MTTLGIKSQGEIGARLRVIACIAGESARVRAIEDRKAAWRSHPGRLTIRRLLALVAVGALVLGTCRHPWYAFCDGRAAYHARMRTVYTKAWTGRTSRNWVIVHNRVFRSPSELAAYQTGMRDYHSRMQEKWERAATLPWLAVLPDGPPPP